MNAAILSWTLFSLLAQSAWTLPLTDNDDTDNQPEPPFVQRRQGDLSTAGTFPINVYANSPYGTAGGLYGSAFGLGNNLNGLNYGGYNGINSLGTSGFNGLSGLTGLGGFNSYGLGGGYGGGYGGLGGGYGGLGGGYGGLGGGYGGLGGGYGALGGGYGGLGGIGQGLYSGAKHGGGKLLTFLSKLTGGGHFNEGFQAQNLLYYGIPGGQIPYYQQQLYGGGLGSSYGFGYGNQFGGYGGINPYAGGIVG